MYIYIWMNVFFVFVMRFSVELCINHSPLLQLLMLSLHIKYTRNIQLNSVFNIITRISLSSSNEWKKNCISIRVIETNLTDWENKLRSESFEWSFFKWMPWIWIWTFEKVCKNVNAHREIYHWREYSLVCVNGLKIKGSDPSFEWMNGIYVCVIEVLQFLLHIIFFIR